MEKEYIWYHTYIYTIFYAFFVVNQELIGTSLNAFLQLSSSVKSNSWSALLLDIELCQ